MKLGIYVAFKERKVWIALGVSGVKVKVTVTKNRKTVSAQKLMLVLIYFHETRYMCTLLGEEGWDCIWGQRGHGQGHCY